MTRARRIVRAFGLILWYCGGEPIPTPATCAARFTYYPLRGRAMTFRIPERFREDYDPPPRERPDRDDIAGLCDPRNVDPDIAADIRDLYREAYPEIYGQAA